MQQINVHVQNNLDYIGLPILSYQLKLLPTLQWHDFFKAEPMINIHKKFDHRSLAMILQMKKHNLMNRLPSDIHHFHHSYKCPICLLTAATKLPRSKIRSKEHFKPGDFFCLNHSFWTTSSIRGFTSILTVIYIKTRYSFTFPTCNKGLSLATIAWFINKLRKQGFSVLYLQSDEGGKLGHNTDFIHLLTKHDCKWDMVH